MRKSPTILESKSAAIYRFAGYFLIGLSSSPFSLTGAHGTRPLHGLTLTNNSAHQLLGLASWPATVAPLDQ